MLATSVELQQKVNAAVALGAAEIQGCFCFGPRAHYNGGYQALTVNLQVQL